ncbi:hypothetical protein P152DRAFT_22004 [Eremomyces bilateralis CBS 781.70]|uniref:Uncharacterized protein n=1 Tax=Eremomyces bilateralis CBS 781.70 TaxID=1392243 RepID=A0A6G1GHE8_9PEZI|nr:uncharacterized protein P152DRAFT_22004 [Eremomyces bilateralis CBS 781.70]KAF1817525.1 hypothetical protein P152DRAFT_22004 [Eremomyces bilateralis CBS 781.70]
MLIKPNGFAGLEFFRFGGVDGKRTFVPASPLRRSSDQRGSPPLTLSISTLWAVSFLFCDILATPSYRHLKCSIHYRLCGFYIFTTYLPRQNCLVQRAVSGSYYPEPSCFCFMDTFLCHVR